MLFKVIKSGGEAVDLILRKKFALRYVDTNPKNWHRSIYVHEVYIDLRVANQKLRLMGCADI